MKNNNVNNAIFAIGDVDNVFKRLLECSPYQYGPTIIKVECKNHLLRNFWKAIGILP